MAGKAQTLRVCWSGLKSNTITCNTSKDERNISSAQENTTDSKLLSEFAGAPNERSAAGLLGVWEVSKTTLGHTCLIKVRHNKSYYCGMSINSENSEQNKNGDNKMSPFC